MRVFVMAENTEAYATCWHMDLSWQLTGPVFNNRIVWQKIIAQLLQHEAFIVRLSFGSQDLVLTTC